MIWAILSLGLILRMISLNQSLWLDEAINTLAVRNNSLINLITQYAKADFHPPGWIILLWGWTKIFGYSEIALRIPSVIFGLLSIWLIYLVGKKLFSKNLGLLTALLIAINPLHIYYSQEARMYAMATLAVLVNILLIIKLIKGEKLNLVFLIISNLLVLSADYVAYFIFPAELIFLLVYKKETVKKWSLALFGAFLLGIWWLPIFLAQFNVGSIASSNLPSWKLINGAFDFKTIPLTYVKFIIGRISLSDKFLYGVLLLPVCSLFAFLLWEGFRAASGLTQKLLASWLIIPILIATIISIVVPVYNYFRVLYILPAFIILISFGILSFNKPVKYFFLFSVIAIELFSSSVYLLNPNFQREDWKGLVNFLKIQTSNPTILFESSGILPPFDYYATGKLNASGALKDFPVKDDSGLADFPKTKDIYLVDYLVEISDPKRLVSRKLDNLGYKKTDIKDFNGVGFLYHYVKE